jgi:DNA-binding transcriptional regulator GbsR (MarR family)
MPNHLSPNFKMNKIEKIFGRNAQLAVWEYLIKNCTTTTYLSGIAEETGLSHYSVARVIEPLLKMNIVKEGKVGKQLRTFTLNDDIEITRLLIRFYEDLSKVLTE